MKKTLSNASKERKFIIKNTNIKSNQMSINLEILKIFMKIRSMKTVFVNSIELLKIMKIKNLMIYLFKIWMMMTMKSNFKKHYRILKKNNLKLLNKIYRKILF